MIDGTPHQDGTRPAPDSRAAASPASPTSPASSTDDGDRTELDSLTQEIAVGRRLALALGALSERAALAEREARAASWDDPDGIDTRLAAARADDDEATRDWTFVESGRFTPAGAHVDPSELNPEATRATDAAVAAVRAAYKAISVAHEAVLTAQLASAEQQAAGLGAGAKRRARLSDANRHGVAMAVAIRSEIGYLLARKPPKVLRALLFAVLSGAIYLAYIRIFEWHTYGKWAPYLAVLFISSVMGTSACFNSFGFDARRVRVALDRGARLWQVLLVKNIALMAVVFPMGLAMCLVLAFLTGRPATLLASIALVLCILSLWSGVGNLLSVMLPIRDAPLKVHRREGTLRLFIVEFAVTWGVSYVVLFLLIWRVYSAQGMGERYNSTWLGVLLLVVSGIVAWADLTVIANAFANQPRVYRRLRRELDWEPVPSDAGTTAKAPATE